MTCTCPQTPTICGCGHALADHSANRTGACQVQVSDEYFCSCISAYGPAVEGVES